MKDYTVTGNRDVAELIERYELTYPQARRYAMREDGLSLKEIAKVEGIGSMAVHNSIRLAKMKMMPPNE
jgi:predicted DNA-binding protein YlxM (UPF0122 family)